MKRIPYEQMRYVRNPNPARGAGILSLDDIRRYIRLFRTDPVYGLMDVEGAIGAFMDSCHVSRQHFRQVFFPPYEMEFVSRRLQTAVSKSILMVLDGKVRFDPDERRAGRAVMVYTPQGTPLQGVQRYQQGPEYALRMTRLGPILYPMGQGLTEKADPRHASRHGRHTRIALRGARCL